MENYLTETKLGDILKIIYPKHEFIRNKIVPNSNVRFRPDYRCDELHLIFEFDGYNHYNSSKRIKMDSTKNRIYEGMGYKVICIPYFVQMDSGFMKNILNLDIEFNLLFPHGFISEDALLPCDYCELGIDKFLKDLNTFRYCRNDIIQSLKNKFIQTNDIELVVPNSLKYLLL